MVLEIAMIRYRIALGMGVPDGDAWSYAVTVQLVPVGPDREPLSGTPLDVLTTLGFASTVVVPVRVPAGEGGLEPQLPAVGGAVMGAVGQAVATARAAWEGKAFEVVERS